MKNVFISFRFSDGKKYKKELCDLFDNNYYVSDFSEDIDRSNLSEETIKKYLYGKIAKSSVTIILLTKEALAHHKDNTGKYDDWMYDEIRYSLEDRENNRTNGLIAIYTPEVENILIQRREQRCYTCGLMHDINTITYYDNLFRVNMMNIYPEYKHNRCYEIYDMNYDSFCSLYSFDYFKRNINECIKIAEEKRDVKYQYKITKRL